MAIKTNLPLYLAADTPLYLPVYMVAGSSRGLLSRYKLILKSPEEDKNNNGDSWTVMCLKEWHKQNGSQAPAFAVCDPIVLAENKPGYADYRIVAALISTAAFWIVGPLLPSASFKPNTLITYPSGMSANNIAAYLRSKLCWPSGMVIRSVPVDHELCHLLVSATSPNGGKGIANCGAITANIVNAVRFDRMHKNTSRLGIRDSVPTLYNEEILLTAIICHKDIAQEDITYQFLYRIWNSIGRAKAGDACAIKTLARQFRISVEEAGEAFLRLQGARLFSSSSIVPSPNSWMKACEIAKEAGRNIGDNHNETFKQFVNSEQAQKVLDHGRKIPGIWDRIEHAMGSIFDILEDWEHRGALLQGAFGSILGSLLYAILFERNMQVALITTALISSSVCLVLGWVIWGHRLVSGPPKTDIARR